MSLKLVKRHKSPNWYIRGSVRGLRVDESTGVADRRQANEIRALREAELVRQSVHGPALVRTFAEAALHYLEQGGDGTHLAAVLNYFGTRKLAEVGQEEVDAAARQLGAGKSPATVNRQIYTPVSAILHHAARLKWCSKPVIARPKQGPERVRYISTQEAERLIAAASDHLRPLVIFLLGTGARLSEALYLDWREVDLANRHVMFIKTKNGERRGVPLHGKVVAALQALPHSSGAVFRRPDGNAYMSRGGEGGGQVKSAWSNMLRRAGITDFTPHDCRHTWATWHYCANRDLTALQQLGGWKSVQMVMRYAHANRAEFTSTIDRMWGETGELRRAA